MRRSDFPAWADSFVLPRELETPGELGELRRRRTSGELVPVLPGAYVPAEVLGTIHRDERHLLVVRAAALTARTMLVFSHHSAAAPWRLPMIGPAPHRAHVTVPPQQGGRSTRSLSRHASWRPVEAVVIDGLTVTSLARTVVDLAAVLPFEATVVAADAALRRTEFPLKGVPRSTVTKTTLVEEHALLPLRHGSARAARAIGFADGRAQLPGESLSRVSMLRAGLPAPILQQKLRGASGKEYFVDFWWPASNVIGEFDGEAKYSDPVYLAGRTPQRAAYEEKLREDDLRLAGYGMCRWDWATARDPRALRIRLITAGLRA